MTLVTCKECGRRAHKGDGMLVTYRGNAYCLDETACELRKEKRDADTRIDAGHDSRGFEGVGDFYSSNPWDRYAAHRAAKGY